MVGVKIAAYDCVAAGRVDKGFNILVAFFSAVGAIGKTTMSNNDKTKQTSTYSLRWRVFAMIFFLRNQYGIHTTT